MTSSRNLWAVPALLLAVPLAFTGLAGLGQARMAPDFQLTSTGFEDGVSAEPVTFNLTDLRGRTVVLDFMAVSCLSCRLVTEDVLKPLAARYAGRDDFILISIDAWADAALFPGFGETREELIALQQETGVPWRHALDLGGVASKYEALQLPKIVVIDGEGRIVHEDRGSISEQAVAKAVARSLDGEVQVHKTVRLGLVAGATIAGVAAFLSPCTVGLLPAALAVLFASRRTSTLTAAAPMALGLAAVYGLLVALIAVLASAGLGPWLRASSESVVALTAVLLVLAGVLAWLPGGAWAQRLAPRLAGRGQFAFGAAYGLASFGCTGPAFIPLLGAAFVDSPFSGLVASLAFLLGLLGVLAVVALLVSGGRRAALENLLGAGSWFGKAVGVLLIAAGGWLLILQWRAGVW